MRDWERPALRTTVLLLVAIGLGARLAPFLDRGGRLLRQFPTEDGYLMLTIARNVALGHGMSTADGSIPTNGTQPLATYLWAACFWLVDGDKVSGVALVLALELAIACAAALALHRLGTRVFHRRTSGDAIATLAAATWFASPLTVLHTMNGLESGLYVLIVLGVLLALVSGSVDESGGPAVRRWAAVGLLLGIAFWVRNDAVLLCGAVGVLHLLNVLPCCRAPLRERLTQLSLAASATLLVAAPWLIQNQLRFGSIVPISGHAESLHIAVGESLSRVPAVLVEYLTVVGQIPSDLERHGPVILGCGVLLLGVCVGVGRASRAWSREERSVARIALGFTVLLAIFYGFFFGAGYFMSRYLFPTSPFFALLLAGAILAGWAGLRNGVLPWIRGITHAAIVVLALGLNVRIYARGSDHPHFQVVQWVEENVPPDTWVGAIQTGTLGFFHDRTINLDGKVNPEALEARARDRIPEYVLEKQIAFLVDWVGITAWAGLPALARHYEVLVKDDARNLAVLRRSRDSRRREI